MGGRDLKWFGAIGALIDNLDSARFPEILIEQLALLIPFEMATIFVYRQRARPLLVLDTFPSKEAKQGVANYLNSTYVLNPFYQSHLKGIESGVYRIRDLAPDGFFDSEYQKSIDIILTEREEIGYITPDWPRGLEEVDIAVVLDEGITAEISVYRWVKEGGFDATSFNRLELVLPVLSACFRAYWKRQGRAQLCGGESPESTADDAFQEFGIPVLTKREREVIQLILRGHSSDSVGRNLDISTSTVKTHRKNAYEKLQISTQAELLSQFLRFAQKDLNF